LLRRAVADTQDEENAEWKSFVLDTEGTLRIPVGQVGHRWQKEKGQWNIKQEDARTARPIVSLLSMKDTATGCVRAVFDDFSEGHTRPACACATCPCARSDGRRTGVRHHGIRSATSRSTASTAGFEGEWPSRLRRRHAPFTPAWQEQYTGIKAATVIDFARQWASTAEKTGAVHASSSAPG
jgi:nitrate reductase alpha subunit